MHTTRGTKPTVVDLFAGAGLFGSAFRRIGFELIHAVELDQVAAETYAQNLGEHIQVGDIAELTPHGHCDVLIAGPPCQGFSTLGSRNADDPRNLLSLQVVEWAKVTKPKIIVIENVAAFLDAPVWKTLAKRLRGSGYQVKGLTLNAVDFGVPQYRERSFTFASRVQMPVVETKMPARSVTVREAWEGLAAQPTNENHHYAPTPTALALARMAAIPVGGDKRDLMRLAPDIVPPSWWKCLNQVTDVWGRMEWERPSNTLRTCLLNPSKGRYIHPDQNRVITLREAARLHSIEDTWKFAGLPTQVARQIGNSVPPGLGMAIAAATMKALLESRDSKPGTLARSLRSQSGRLLRCG